MQATEPVDVRWRSAARRAAFDRLLTYLLIVLVGVGFTLQFLYMRSVLDDTNRAVRNEIPSLKAQRASDIRQIADDKVIIEQAVGHILRLCDLLEARGGDCGRIELKAPEH